MENADVDLHWASLIAARRGPVFPFVKPEGGGPLPLSGQSLVFLASRGAVGLLLPGPIPYLRRRLPVTVTVNVAVLVNSPSLTENWIVSVPVERPAVYFRFGAVPESVPRVGTVRIV
jgi:hypothetical protein